MLAMPAGHGPRDDASGEACGSSKEPERTPSALRGSATSLRPSPKDATWAFFADGLEVNARWSAFWVGRAGPSPLEPGAGLVQPERLAETAKAETRAGTIQSALARGAFVERESSCPGRAFRESLNRYLRDTADGYDPAALGPRNNLRDALGCTGRFPAGKSKTAQALQ
jgi:hypothetical protein